MHSVREWEVAKKGIIKKYYALSLWNWRLWRAFNLIYNVKQKKKKKQRSRVKSTRQFSKRESFNPRHN